MDNNKSAATQSKCITVTVVYATEQRQEIIELQCPRDTTLQQAIMLSGICEKCPDIVLKDDLVGVYGEQRKLTDNLADQDRVEIYRPLLLSPTQARRLRAKTKVKTKTKTKAQDKSETKREN